MKRLRFPTGVGNGQATIPGGQLLDISMVPGETGSWLQIANNEPIWVPPGTTFEIGAQELGLCCGASQCDMYPGEVQIVIIFGQNVNKPDPDIGVGSAPLSWFAVYHGC